MKVKKVTGLLLAAVITASAITGCGINKQATVATMGDQEITLGIVNFMCRYQQASTDDIYKQYFGENYDNYWLEDIQGSGSTMEDSLKDTVIEDVHNLYTLKEHMDEYNVEITDDEKSKITEVATSFMESNSKKALNAMGATKEIVEEMLTLYTIQDKMHDAMIADVDTNVTDEEANMRAYTMLTVSTASYTNESGETAEYTDEEKLDIKTKVDAIASAVNAKNKKKKLTLEEAAAKYNYSENISSDAYDKDEDVLDADVKTALDGLKEGQTSGTIETDSAYYIVRIDKETDVEKTKENKESIIKERQDTAYNDKLTKWQEDDKWSVDEKVLKRITFSNYFTQATESDEKDTATEPVTETGAQESQTPEETETGAVTETEAATEAATETATEAVTTESETTTESVAK